MASEGGRLTRRSFLRTAAGASAVVGAAGDAGAQDGGEGGQGEQREVEMTDQLEFVPTEITAAPGDTVIWVNAGNVAHSVTAYEDQIPADADYFASGGFDSEQAARDAYPEGSIGGDGDYQHTFQIEGAYEYFCIPHEQAGMVGTVQVQAAGGDGGGDGAAPAAVVSEAAKTLGVALVSALLSALGLAFFFIKYGGDYEEAD